MLPVLGREDGWFNCFVTILELLVYIISMDSKQSNQDTYVQTAGHFQYVKHLQKKVFALVAEVVRSNLTLALILT